MGVGRGNKQKRKSAKLEGRANTYIYIYANINKIWNKLETVKPC